jgi:hypothetical protein
MTGAIRITNWRPARRGALLGYCRAEFPSGAIICEISILTSPHGLWAAPPAKPRISPDGSVKRDERGKASYVTLIDFTSLELKHRWSSSIIAAMREAYPNFDEEPAGDAVQEVLE